MNNATMIIDTWMDNLGTLCWAQEQGEKVLRSWIDQGAVSRSEGQKIAHRVAEQVKKNQADMQQFIQNSVKLSLETVRKAHELQMESLNQRMEEMGRTIDRLAKDKK